MCVFCFYKNVQAIVQHTSGLFVVVGVNEVVYEFSVSSQYDYDSIENNKYRLY